jgi:hypothetical protein
VNDEYLRLLRDLTGLYLELDQTGRQRMIGAIRGIIRAAMDTQPYPSDAGEKFFDEEVSPPCCDKKIRVELSCVS